MNKFELAAALKTTDPVDREIFITEACAGKDVLDLGCIRHSAEFALKDPTWLHKKIKAAARKVVGVDYIPEEIKKINANGYEVIFGDVTKPIELDEKFDVIIAGDLIEHLSNFEGFFSNCARLLKPGGTLIITTPNPFYAQEFHYVAFRKNFLVNPEHTCWIDPQCLSQLSSRFGFSITKAAYITPSWKLSRIVCETEGHSYDIFSGRWENDTFAFKVKRKLVWALFGMFYAVFIRLTGANSRLCRYSDYLAVLKHTNKEN